MAYPPDSMLDVDPADELALLVGQIKNQLARHHASGTWAAPGGATTRREIAHEPTIEAPDVGAAPELIDEPAGQLSQVGRRTLAQIRAELGDCTRCKLHSPRKSI